MQFKTLKKNTTGNKTHKCGESVPGRRKKLAAIVYNESSRRFGQWRRNVRERGIGITDGTGVTLIVIDVVLLLVFVVVVSVSVG